MIGGGSVKVWGAFSYAEKCDLQRVDCKINMGSYQQMLYGSLIPFGSHLGRPKFNFHQHNAPSHTTKTTNNWFKRGKIAVIS